MLLTYQYTSLTTFLKCNQHQNAIKDKGLQNVFTYSICVPSHQNRMLNISMTNDSSLKFQLINWNLMKDFPSRYIHHQLKRWSSEKMSALKSGWDKMTQLTIRRSQQRVPIAIHSTCQVCFFPVIWKCHASFLFFIIMWKLCVVL